MHHESTLRLVLCVLSLREHLVLAQLHMLKCVLCMGQPRVEDGRPRLFCLGEEADEWKDRDYRQDGDGPSATKAIDFRRGGREIKTTLSYWSASDEFRRSEKSGRCWGVRFVGSFFEVKFGTRSKSRFEEWADIWWKSIRREGVEWSEITSGDAEMSRRWCQHSVAENLCSAARITSVLPVHQCLGRHFSSDFTAAAPAATARNTAAPRERRLQPCRKLHCETNAPTDRRCFARCGTRRPMRREFLRASVFKASATTVDGSPSRKGWNSVPGHPKGLACADVRRARR